MLVGLLVWYVTHRALRTMQQRYDVACRRLEGRGLAFFCVKLRKALGSVLDAEVRILGEDLPAFSSCRPVAKDRLASHLLLFALLVSRKSRVGRDRHHQHQSDFAITIASLCCSS